MVVEWLEEDPVGRDEIVQIVGETHLMVSQSGSQSVSQSVSQVVG